MFTLKSLRSVFSVRFGAKILQTYCFQLYVKVSFWSIHTEKIYCTHDSLRITTPVYENQFSPNFREVKCTSINYMSVVGSRRFAK